MHIWCQLASCTIMKGGMGARKVVVHTTGLITYMPTCGRIWTCDEWTDNDGPHKGNNVDKDEKVRQACRKWACGLQCDTGR